MPFVDYFQEREQQAERRGAERGKELGEKLGEKLGLKKGIQAVLHLRLPDQEKALMARVEQVDDLEALGRILEAASAADVEQLERLLVDPRNR